VNLDQPDLSVDGSASGRRARPDSSWKALLQRFYAPTGLSVPALEELKGAEVPPPYQSLLVHSWDMTPTLARFYGQPLRLRVFGRERMHNLYKREVILWLSEDGRPVEYGVIRIHLDRLPPAAQRLVLQEERPLGDILQAESIPHLSWPQAFFRLKADAHTGSALALSRPSHLYGRRNVLLDGSRQLLADVIEVLAPVAETKESADRGERKPSSSASQATFAGANHRRLRQLRLTKIRT
jgi:chorismate-pyruvate lyase